MGSAAGLPAICCFLQLAGAEVWDGHQEGKVAACTMEVLMSHTQSSGRERSGFIMW